MQIVSRPSLICSTQLVSMVRVNPPNSRSSAARASSWGTFGTSSGDNTVSGLTFYFRFRCRAGEWKPGVPTCVPRDCHVPSVHHATRVPSEVSHVPHGGHVTITCHSGYRLAGSATLRCDHGVFPANHFIIVTIIIPRSLGSYCASVCGCSLPTTKDQTRTLPPEFAQVSNYELCQNLHFL